MGRKASLVLVASLCALAATAPEAPTVRAGTAQELPESLRPLAFLVGDWAGTGELFGQPAVFAMSWAPALDGRFLRLRFRNALGTPGDERPILSAEGLYRPTAEGGWEGTWFDTRGKRLDLRGSLSADGTALRIEWSDPGVEEGVTVYRSAGDHVEVTDSVRAPEGMRFFGRATYTRAEGDGPA